MKSTEMIYIATKLSFSSITVQHLLNMKSTEIIYIATNLSFSSITVQHPLIKISVHIFVIAIGDKKLKKISIYFLFRKQFISLWMSLFKKFLSLDSLILVAPFEACYVA